MHKYLTLSIEVPPSREITIKLPDDIPVGPVTVTITIQSEEQGKMLTLGDLATSEFFGIWKDDNDIAERLWKLREVQRGNKIDRISLEQLADDDEEPDGGR